jgi:hypothetical protein
MSSPWQSGSREEALDALPEIDSLAKELLSSEKYDETMKIALTLLKPWKERRRAHATLGHEIGLEPTRPLLYLWPLMQGLPRGTRDCIRYLGDYLDLLTKEMAFEFVGGKARQRSLGGNAVRLSKADLPPEIQAIAKILQRYNEFIYTPGKHDFSHPPGRKHRFTAREVVLTTYISAVIAQRIKAASKVACTAIEKDNLYTIGGRWGSKSRVEYVQ